jgi:hypothetical protein
MQFSRYGSVLGCRQPSSKIAGEGLLIWFFFLLEFFIFLAETFDATRRINQFLLPGKKRMAF